MMEKMIRISCLLLLLLAGTLSVPAQVVDGVAAIVGEEVVLKSDIESQYGYMIANGEKDDGTLRCRVVEKIVIEKLLLNKAEQDSLVVSDGEVEQELARRIEYFIQGYGGVDKLEAVYQKSVVEIRAELRPEIKNQILIQRMREKILGDISVTPREVRKFYNDIPKDSLPILPAEVELYHLAIEPKPSESAKAATEKKLNEIRMKVVKGEATFEDMAKRYSEDFGSAKLGGRLGEFGRGKMVPEFEEIAFKTDAGEISPVFESAFGFHVMMVHKRVGEVVDASHILMIPKRNSTDDSVALARLAELKLYIERDSMSFQEAALEFSDDQATKSNGGAIKNPQNGEYRIPHDLLDADFFFKVDRMKEGDISEPEEWIQADGSRAFHILYLKDKIPPHTASLEEDYQKITSAATQSKQSIELEKWFQKARENIYIEIKDQGCETILQNWIK